MIVMKFGGTSVESAEAIERVASIVRARLQRQPVVVVSAMGKTTNRLLALARLAAEGKQADALAQVSELREFHWNEARRMVIPEEKDNLHASLDAHFEELSHMVAEIAQVEAISPKMVDAVSSLGERLSSIIVTHAFRYFGMPAAHVDSRTVVITDTRHTQAAPFFDLTYPRLQAAIPPLAKSQVVVMGGFIASTRDGVATTLGRGGSDFTASIIGAGIGAEEIQIWTDVDGMLTCDPRILPGGHLIRTISFDEAAELAYFGAKVLHPATVLPAMDKNIPVLVLNSRRPEVSGTRIVNQPPPCKNPIKSIACKTDITVVRIHSLRMLMAYGFLRRIFEVFDRFQTPVDMVTTSEVSVSLTIDNPQKLNEIRLELEGIAGVEVEQGRAIVCVVGDDIRGTPGIGARIFRALEGVNVLMVSQGSSKLNFSFLVDAADLKRAVAGLHNEFFQELDPEVFA
ncbi:MAG: lysine-sensitive aspartokinase 3 [Candidatus Solibacter usitatus]|nr:lysine-sensitive aspartokinase 3 [Candidatus Solibacter usitatus]